MRVNVAPRDFLMNVLQGSAQAIPFALLPYAILAVFLQLFPQNQFAKEMLVVIKGFQFLTPIMTGFLIGNRFGLTALQQAAVGGAAMIGSGAVAYIGATVGGQDMHVFQLAGIGDLINTMLTAALAVYMIMLVGDKFGSLNLILLPILIGTGIGYFSYKVMLPPVSQINHLIGEVINSFTTLQPFIMNLLICMTFSLIIISPISSIAIALAIGLDGSAAGAAGMGVATCMIYMTIATALNKENKKGVSIAVALGAVKMLMPNLFRYPKIMIPIMLSAAITSIPVTLFHIIGTPQSGGFGIIGMVSPIASLEGEGMSMPLMLVCWLVIPIVVSFAVHWIFEHYVKIYSEEAYVYHAE